MATKQKAAQHIASTSAQPTPTDNLRLRTYTSPAETIGITTKAVVPSWAKSANSTMKKLIAGSRSDPTPDANWWPGDRSRESPGPPGGRWE